MMVEVWARGRGDDAEAIITHVIGPWWLLAVAWFVEHAAEIICDCLYVPEWVGKRMFVRREWTEGQKQRFSFYEWYGTHPFEVLHSRALTWTYKLFRRREIAVPMRDLIAAWGDDAPQWWKDQLLPLESEHDGMGRK